MSEILELVADYVSQGLAIFPCRGKTPLIPGGFKNATKDPDVAKAWWTKWPDASIAMATGAMSGFSVLDVDCKPSSKYPNGAPGYATLAALEATHGPLPATRTSLTPSGGLHYWFTHEPGWWSTTDKLGAGLDTRGDGGYIIIPPSATANGSYSWKDVDAPFANVPAWVLAGIEKRGPGRPPLPASEKVSRHPTKVARKVPASDIQSALVVLTPDCDYNTWLEIGMGLHAWDAALGLAIWDNWSKPGKAYTDGGCAEKWASFGSSDGIGIATVFHHAKAAGWIGPAGREIEQYNLDHAVVLVSGKCRVLKETPGANGRVELDFLGVNDFTDYNRNRISWSVSPTGKPVKTFTAQEWLEWKGRRSFEGLTFAPSGKCPANLYNMFRGFGVEPSPGDWSLMRDHILTVICNGNAEHFAYLMAWCARVVQDPGGERPGTAVVMKGGQGTGKGTFATNFGKIIGPHFVPLSRQEQLTSKFNSQLKDVLVVFADEAVFPGDKSSVGRLKSLITEDSITIEPKGVNSFQVPNHVSLIMASNESWVVPADMDDRRFFVLDVSNARKQDHTYFRAIKDQMANGGLAAWLFDLLALDVSKVNLFEAPKTDARAAQIVAGLPLPELYWYECVQDGQIKTADSDGRDTTQGAWPTDVDKDQLYGGFVEFCGERRVRHVPTKSWFFRRLVEHSVSPIHSKDPTRRKMDVPDLDAARAQWARVLGSSVAVPAEVPF